MLFNCFYLLFTMIFNCFHLFFKSFSWRRIIKLCLFYNSTLIRRYNFLTCNSYLSILLDNNVDIFPPSLLVSYCSSSSQTLSSFVMISFYTLSKRLFLKLMDYLIQEYYQSLKMNTVLRYTFIVKQLSVFSLNPVIYLFPCKIAGSNNFFTI